MSMYATMFHSTDNKGQKVLYILIVLAIITGTLMLIDPLSTFLDSGHLSRTNPWPWILIEEPIIALTRYVSIFITLSVFWRLLGQTFDVEIVFYKVLQLYWVEFAIFMLFCIMLLLQISALKSLAFVFPFFVPSVQSFIIIRSFERNDRGKLGGVVVFLVSLTLIAAGGIAHTIAYDYLASIFL